MPVFPEGVRVIIDVKSIVLVNLNATHMMQYERVKVHSLINWVLQCNACVWIFLDKASRIVGYAFAHVDDFCLCGDGQNAEWKRIRELIKGLHQWGHWESGAFRFAGIDVVQESTGDIALSQAFYSAGLKDF